MRPGPTSGLVLFQLALSLLLLCLCLVSGVGSCFIRNCPMGGKRSLEQAPSHPAQRKCLACGPTGQGQCVGPDICCDAEAGCYINTAESAPCRAENELATPCQVEGSPCDGGAGYCMAESVCCSDEKCFIASACQRKRQKQRDWPIGDATVLKKLLQLKALMDGY